MLSPADLASWQKRNGLRTDAEAGKALGMTAGTYWRKRRGRMKIDLQDEMLAEYYELATQLDPLRLAELGDAINKVVRRAISRR